VARTYPVVPHKVFAGGASGGVNGVAQFGSKQTGTPDYTANIASIQALAAWLQGWAGAVALGKVPPLEELNAAFLEPSYQIASLFECGIPDWNAGITYSTYSLCQSGGIVYQSLIDSNTGNAPASSPSDWQIFSPSTAKGENLFRNGGFLVAQRGTSGTITAGSPAYSLDGWIIGCTTHNVAWSQSLLNGGATAPNLLINQSGGTPTDALVKQRIESFVVSALPSSGYLTVQVTIYNATGSSFTPKLTVNYANAVDNFSSVTAVVNAVNLQACPSGSYTTVAYTFAINSNYFNGMEVIFDFGGALTNSTAADGIYLSRADLSYAPYLQNAGLQSNPPNPQIRPIGVEMPFCQRYFNQISSTTSDINVGIGTILSSTAAQIQIHLPASLRAIPTIAFVNIGSFSIVDMSATSSTVVSAYNSLLGYVNQFNNFLINLTKGSGGSQGDSCSLVTTNTNAALQFSAEL
jgi:hypothetical protein